MIVQPLTKESFTQSREHSNVRASESLCKGPDSKRQALQAIQPLLQVLDIIAAV